MSCNYCSYLDKVNQPDQLGAEYKFQQYCNLIDRIYKPTAVKVLGGEPLLFPYYEQLIYKLLSNSNIKEIIVFTNCSKPLKIIDDRIIYLISLHKNHYNLLNIFKRNQKEIYKNCQFNVLIDPNQQLDSQIYEILEFCKNSKIYVFPQLIERPDINDNCPHQTWYSHEYDEWYKYVYNKFAKYYTNLYDDNFELTISGKPSTFLNISQIYKQEVLKNSRYFSTCNSYFITENLGIEDITYNSADTINDLTIDNFHNADVYFLNRPLKDFCIYELMFSKSIILDR